MPIPTRALKAEMPLGREVPVLQAQGDEQQHQHAQKHVEAVKTSEHEEGRTVHTRVEFEVQVGIEVKVFIGVPSFSVQ